MIINWSFNVLQHQVRDLKLAVHQMRPRVHRQLFQNQATVSEISVEVEQNY